MKSYRQFINEVKKPTGDLKKACWTGYTAVGMKMKGGRKVPNCVPEEVEQLDEYGDTAKGQKMLTKVQKRAVDRVVSRRADTDPKYAKKNSDTANRAWERMTNTHEEVELDETAAWQRKEGKRESGGLNQKGVDSYRREHPGSKLKTAVTTKPSKLKPGSKAANRRKSFCARMSGMKKRLTSAKTAHDPNSRINKSLRKWNC